MRPSDYSTVFIHSDITKYILSAGVDLKSFYYTPRYRSQVLRSYCEAMQCHFPSADIWVPTFNYSYCDTGVYNVKTCGSQVGVFSEFFRLSIAEWRTGVPIFSVAGTGTEPLGDGSQHLIDPFGDGSVFSRLVDVKGALVNYDSLFSPTFIHFIERMHNDGPLYRYDKHFSGEVVNGESIQNVTVNYHVIPRGLLVSYDTAKILRDLLSNEIAVLLPDGIGCVVDARKMLNFCLLKLDDNPLYFLHGDCLARVQAELDRTGRRFIIDDFLDSHRRFQS